MTVDAETVIDAIRRLPPKEHDAMLIHQLGEMLGTMTEAYAHMCGLVDEMTGKPSTRTAGIIARPRAYVAYVRELRTKDPVP